MNCAQYIFLVDVVTIMDVVSVGRKQLFDSFYTTENPINVVNVKC